MSISIMVSDKSHPINAYILAWISRNNSKYEITLARDRENLVGGNFLFLISCSEILSQSDIDKYKYALVLHASDLPRGRGWSPHIWEIAEGGEFVTISLIEAAVQVDGGRIWGKKKLSIPKHALWNEINDLIFMAELDLVDYAINHASQINPMEQELTISPTYHRKRTPRDSEINPTIDLASQFDKIRVSDPNRYPAFFWLNGHKYNLIVEKVVNEINGN